jgi:aspartyl-tRNA(Asn)/glutamyl-tRNA(Gln) amidotransferase subunit C
MAVTIQDVEHVAALAKLEFSAEEKIALTSQLNTILEYMDQLNRLDTTAVQPLSHVIDLKNVFRDDARIPGVSRNEALRNAPAHNEVFFKVPKVLGGR